MRRLVRTWLESAREQTRLSDVYRSYVNGGATSREWFELSRQLTDLAYTWIRIGRVLMWAGIVLTTTAFVVLAFSVALGVLADA